MRDQFLRGAVLLAVATVTITECLSPFHLLRRGPVVFGWLVLAIAAGALLRRRVRFQRLAIRPLGAAIVAVIAVIVAGIAFTAWKSPPNSGDAMAYHLPRVIYWLQSGSIAFFPTPYFNQISLQPLTEYCYLHTYLISGGDHFVNLVSCAAFAGAIVAVSSIAGALGLRSRGQAFAAFFCATLPAGILQASGAKNDCMLALWLACAVYFAVSENAVFTGLGVGLALATKATGYLFAPPMLVCALLILRKPLRAKTLLWMAAGVLLLNGPQYIRNMRLSGSPLGPDSAQGDGVYRWRNEHPGLRATVSNLIRHTSEQLGDRQERWNQAVFAAALALHRKLGIDPQDPDTTWRYAEFVAPGNKNHEADGNSHWHLLLLVVAAIFALAARQRTWIVYGAGLLAALLLFCFFLKWQPYMARMTLPLFVLAAPLAGAFLEALRPAALAVLLCVFLGTTARLSLVQNWTRPLKGPNSLFASSYDDNYFRDIMGWNPGTTYLPAVDLVARSGCREVGVDITRDQVEYPLLALLRERTPGVRFVHVGVVNASARYAVREPAPVCAVICPDCTFTPGKVAEYSAIGPPVEFDHFLVFVRR